MAITIDDLVGRITGHRCYSHPIFDHWAMCRPGSEVVGALFHQIRSFCDATRPGGRFPDALAVHSLSRESTLLQEIVESEENHSSDLATMAGYIVNKAASRTVFPDLYDQETVEQGLKDLSDRVLQSVPGYDRENGLLPQTRRAREVFDGRQSMDRESTLRNLGTALALEMISNRHLIPGEIGAEQQHEKNAVAALGSVLNPDTEDLIVEGVDAFLDGLADLWDVLDSVLQPAASR
jgi:hypothetical protein